MNQNIIVSVDAVILTLVENRLNVVIMERGHAPYAGVKALPGGYIHDLEDDTAMAAASRVLEYKVNIAVPYLSQLATYSGKVRDPRGWSVSIAFYAIVPYEVIKASEHFKYELCPVDELPELAFDHNKIVADAVKRVRDKSVYSSLPCFLLPEKFTLTELQKTYEYVLGEKQNKSNFRRKIKVQDFLEVVQNEMQTGVQRPAELFTLKEAKKLFTFDSNI